MFFFSKKNTHHLPDSIAQLKDFSYRRSDEFYFDSACQTMRPWQVVEAQQEYYRDFNACGGRVKYRWGQRVDERVAQAREGLLDLVGKSSKEYAIVFTLNTTYAVNLLLQQLPSRNFERLITSEIEHNSVFLPSMIWARRHGLERLVLPRDEAGNLLYDSENFRKAVVLVNSVSNIDGRKLLNAQKLANDLHESGGLLLLDGAQHFGHHVGELRHVDFDAIFGSAHKMYGPSLGFMIVKKKLLSQFEYFLLGGGTVTDVQRDSYELIQDPEELHASLELGLQNWAGIIGLEAAMRWLKEFRPDDSKPVEYEQKLSHLLWQKLQKIEGLEFLNREASPVVSFYKPGLDSHRLALYLSEQNIMCRSGYFCCHYFLKNLKKYPPLLRISLGLNVRPEDIEEFAAILVKILKNV